MAEPAGYAHAATLATTDPDLAVRLAGELREAREALARVRADVPRALDRFETNLAYTAPELWHTRVAELREEIEYALEDPPDGTS